MIQLDFMSLFALMGIPSAITGLCFWMVQRKITKRDAAREKQDAGRKKNEQLVIKGVTAAIALGEATAKSIQKLDKECNGEMAAALEYAKKVKNEQRDFLHEQGIENLY